MCLFSGQGSVSNCFTVMPIISPGAATLRLMLKQTDLNASPKDQNAFKKDLQSLETELETLKKIRHQNILTLYDFKVHKMIDEAADSYSVSRWTVSVLCEFGDKGSLGEILGIAESLGVNKVRSWTIELLDALRYLHDHGIVHEDIHTDNILLVRESTGEVRPKLADSGFQRKLHNLSGRKQSPDTISLAKSAYWIPPEIANTNQPQYSQKTGQFFFPLPNKVLRRLLGSCVRVAKLRYRCMGLRSSVLTDDIRFERRPEVLFAYRSRELAGSVRRAQRVCSDIIQSRSQEASSCF